MVGAALRSVVGKAPDATGWANGSHISGVVVIHHDDQIERIEIRRNHLPRAQG